MGKITDAPYRWFSLESLLRRGKLHLDLLEPTETTSRCPYKGKATACTTRVNEDKQPLRHISMRENRSLL